MKKNIYETAKQRRNCKIEIVDTATGDIIETTLEKGALALGYSLVKMQSFARWQDKATEMMDKGMYIRWKKKEKIVEEKQQIDNNIQHEFF